MKLMEGCFSNSEGVSLNFYGGRKRKIKSKTQLLYVMLFVWAASFNGPHFFLFVFELAHTNSVWIHFKYLSIN